MKKNLRRIIPAIIAALLLFAFLGYVETYYHADTAAGAALRSDENVRVTRKKFGWFFDGESEEHALVFYPGAKVEAEAYAPLCRALAESGIDVCLAEMPFHLAVFGKNKAEGIIGSMDYAHWYMAGHSLGGVMAARYAAEHGDQIDGLILLAAYPDRQLEDDLSTVLVYGTEDGVLDMKQYQKNLRYVPPHSIEHVIEGGNHAQFGSYGAQKGDGTALISPEQQVEETALVIAGNMMEMNR